MHLAHSVYAGLIAFASASPLVKRSTGGTATAGLTPNVTDAKSFLLSVGEPAEKHDCFLTTSTPYTFIMDVPGGSWDPSKSKSAKKLNKTVYGYPVYSEKVSFDYTGVTDQGAPTHSNTVHAEIEIVHGELANFPCGIGLGADYGNEVQSFAKSLQSDGITDNLNVTVNYGHDIVFGGTKSEADGADPEKEAYVAVASLYNRQGWSIPNVKFMTKGDIYEDNANQEVKAAIDLDSSLILLPVDVAYKKYARYNSTSRQEGRYEFYTADCSQIDVGKGAGYTDLGKLAVAVNGGKEKLTIDLFEPDDGHGNCKGIAVGDRSLNWTDAVLGVDFLKHFSVVFDQESWAIDFGALKE